MGPGAPQQSADARSGRSCAHVADQAVQAADSQRPALPQPQRLAFRVAAPGAHAQLLSQGRRGRGADDDCAGLEARAGHDQGRALRSSTRTSLTFGRLASAIRTPAPGKTEMTASSFGPWQAASSRSASQRSRCVMRSESAGPREGRPPAPQAARAGHRGDGRRAPCPAQQRHLPYDRAFRHDGNLLRCLLAGRHPGDARCHQQEMPGGVTAPEQNRPSWRGERCQELGQALKVRARQR